MKVVLDGMLQNLISQQFFTFKQNNINPMNSMNSISFITTYTIPSMQMSTFSSNIDQRNRGLQQYLEMETLNAIGRFPQNSKHHENLAAIELNLIDEGKKRIEQPTQYLQIVQPTENIHHVNPIQNILACLLGSNLFMCNALFNVFQN